MGEKVYKFVNFHRIFTLSMIVYFETHELRELYEIPLAEIRGKRKIPIELIKQYKKRIQLLIAI